MNEAAVQVPDRDHWLVGVVKDSMAPGYQEALEGIHAYASSQDDLETCLIGTHYGVATNFQGLKVDAVIGGREELIQLQKDSRTRGGLPNLLFSIYKHYSVPYVGLNPDKGGELVAQHLADLHLTQYGFFRAGDRHYSRHIETGFVRVMREKRLPIECFLEGSRVAGSEQWSLSDQLADLADWLSERPKPFGLCCPDETHAERALQACRLAGLRVPEQVALITVFGMPVICSLMHPSVSHVDFPRRALGEVAIARVHHALKTGEVPPTSLLDPQTITINDSTRIVGVEDIITRRALEWLDAHLTENLDVSRMCAELNINRRTLERRFSDVLDKSPAKVIRHKRLERARKLIMTTNLTMSAIAGECGFDHSSRLSLMIKQAYGVTPRVLRKQGHQLT